MLRRHVPDGVVPLEVWDALVNDQPLYLLSEEQLPLAICQLVAQLRAGQATRLRAGASLPRVEINHVMLGGGGVTEATARALRDAGISAEVYPDPVWIGEAGGHALLSMFSPTRRGAVMEVGQTSVKYSDPEGRVRLSRPWTSVPLESESRTMDRQLLRSQTLRFLSEAPRARKRPEALVLAMPCEIDSALCVSGCSYPWSDGDPELITDLLALAGLAGIPTAVLNDAELAAVSTSRIQAERTLVLTLGLGLGGAYLAAVPA